MMRVGVVALVLVACGDDAGTSDVGEADGEVGEVGEVVDPDWQDAACKGAERAAPVSMAYCSGFCFTMCQTSSSVMTVSVPIEATTRTCVSFLRSGMLAAT